MLVIKQLMVPIDFHFFPYYGSQWGPSWPTTVRFFNIVQNIFFCDQHKKETHTGLERHDDDE